MEINALSYKSLEDKFVRKLPLNVFFLSVASDRGGGDKKNHPIRYFSGNGHNFLGNFDLNWNATVSSQECLPELLTTT